MKSRLLYFFISIIILSIFTGTFIWHNKNSREITKFNERSFTAPISSKYIPSNADIIFHWKINPKILPKYIENHQDNLDRNMTNKKFKFIIDSAFQLIGLDFEKDISKWIGEYGSFAIIDTSNELLNDWLMVLEVKEDINLKEEFESISDSNIIDENINQSNELNIYKLKLNSEEPNSNQSIYYSNNKGNILISSNPQIINSSTNQSEKNTLDTKKKYKEFFLKDNISDGVLLLEMSPNKIFNILEQEENLLEINQADKLISSINIDKNKLTLEGILAYNIKTKTSIKDPIYDLEEIDSKFNSFNNFLLIDNPNKYFGKNLSHPYQKLIASIIKESTKTDYSNLFEIILKNTKGNLIWLKDKNWLTLTSKSDTNKHNINDILKKENFSDSNLELKNNNLEIWSNITTNNNEGYELKENVEAIIGENENLYIWSKDLSSIANFDEQRYLNNNTNNEINGNKNNDYSDIIRIHMGKDNAKVFLNNFYPFILLRTFLGNKLNFPEIIDISFSIPTINYPDFVKFRVNLKTS